MQTSGRTSHLSKLLLGMKNSNYRGGTDIPKMLKLTMDLLFRKQSELVVELNRTDARTLAQAVCMILLLQTLERNGIARSYLPNILIPSLGRKPKPIKPNGSRVDTDLLRLDNDVLPHHTIKLNIAARFVRKRAGYLIVSPAAAVLHVATVVVAAWPRLGRRSPEFKEVFQSWQGDDYDRDAHFGHGPNVYPVPVSSSLYDNKAGEVHGDGQETKRKGDDETPELTSS